MKSSYKLITTEEADFLSVLQLAEMCNDAVETTWYLQKRLIEFSEENNTLWGDQEDLSDRLYQ